MNTFTDRSLRLKNLINKNDCTINHDLLVGFLLEKTDLAALQYTVCNYLWQSAYAVGINLEFPDNLTWFDKNAEILATMPNVTPNGVVMPKIENHNAYNQMHQAVSAVVKKYVNPHAIASIFMPINVRLVTGVSNSHIDSRPRASTKIHSDIWAAEHSNSVTIFLTVLGDSENTTVDFFEPTSFPTEFQKPLSDYNDGAILANGAKKYPPSFLSNHMIAMDSFCLHQTVKNRGNFRLSLDFRIIYSKILEDDFCLHTPRYENYIPADKWLEIGTSQFMSSKQSIKQPISDETRNTLISKFNVIQV